MSDACKQTEPLPPAPLFVRRLTDEEEEARFVRSRNDSDAILPPMRPMQNPAFVPKPDLDDAGSLSRGCTQADLETENRTIRAFLQHAMGLLGTSELYLPSVPIGLAAASRLEIVEADGGMTVRRVSRGMGS